MSKEMTRRQFMSRLLGSVAVVGVASGGRLMGHQLERKTPPKSFTIREPKIGDSITLFHTDTVMEIESIKSTGTSHMDWELGYQREGAAPTIIRAVRTRDLPFYVGMRIPGNARVFATVVDVEKMKGKRELSGTLFVRS